MSEDVRKSVPHPTTEPVSIKSSSSYQSDGVTQQFIDDSFEQNLMKSSGPERHTVGRDDQLHRQSSTATQVASNCTDKHERTQYIHTSVQYDKSISDCKDNFPCISLNKSDEEEKKSSSNATVSTVAASFVAHTPNTSSLAYTSFSDICSEGETRSDHATLPSLPLHLKEDDNLSFYRVVYRGVVALLSSPDDSAPRSGTYLSYGEVFASRRESLPAYKFKARENFVLRNQSDENQAFVAYSYPPPPPPPPRQGTSSGDEIANHIRNKETQKNSFVKVERILTGGYAMDITNSTDVDLDADTPKRSNTGETPPESLSIRYPSDEMKHLETKNKSFLGYLCVEKKDLIVAEPLEAKPKLEEGKFLYKIMSSTPVPILTGPSFDAPKTKALLLPGAVQEVSLRISIDPEGDGVFFLRLSHRRGWIPDRKISSSKGKTLHSTPIVTEITHHDSRTDDCSLSVYSSVATSVSCSTSATRHRHRPPRRRRDDNSKDASMDRTFPRHVGGKPPAIKSNFHSDDASAQERLITPSSNVSILSDDSSLEHNASIRNGHPTSPDTSFATNRSTLTNRSFASNKSTGSASTPNSQFFLVRVNAPRGLKILDAPQFQVSHLIRGKQGTTNVSSSHMVSQFESNMGPPKTHHSIFQTMSGRLTTTGPSKTGNPAIFDATSKTRILPRGVLFEASRRMENTGAFSQGAGLIKLSDNSGWAIVPRQDELDRQYRSFSGGVANVKEGEATRAFEEVGNATIESSFGDHTGRLATRWLRVVTRAGVSVSCPPPLRTASDEDTSPSSSRGSSVISGSNVGSSFARAQSNDSDIASSVGSAFLDAMFRTPNKKKDVNSSHDKHFNSHMQTETRNSAMVAPIPCGSIVEVESWSDTSVDRSTQDFVRLCGGQGWIPLTMAGKTTAVVVPRPEIRYGSIWFRVQSLRGIKVRLGPSKRAPSIKSEDGIHFRFECGEFLRASEILTIFSNEDKPIECFAKLYRNRHVQLQSSNTDFKPLATLTAQSEWVQVYNESESFLEECAAEPRIERHKQGWRYNVVPDSGVEVRKGPSFAAEKTGIILFGGESVLINERVSPPGEKMTWLRMKDGNGWIYDSDESANPIMVPHSLRHRTQARGKSEVTKDGSEIAYNTIIARLFHNDAPEDGMRKLR